MNKNSVLERWQTEGLLKKCPHILFRMEEEQRSLLLLKKRKGYLAAYDSGIRYMILFFLTYNYDINHSSIHFVFRKYLQEIMLLTPDISKKIIDHRHGLKYEGKIVPDNLLKTIYNTNQEISKLI